MHEEQLTIMRSALADLIGVWKAYRRMDIHDWEAHVETITELANLIREAASCITELADLIGEAASCTYRIPPMTDEQIIDVFNRYPNLLLTDLAKITGKTVQELKKILLNNRN